MIELKQGNLLETDAEALVNTVIRKAWQRLREENWLFHINLRLNT